jgi:uncharacterized SAM-binding protein YcdF (DUF218 family)
MDLIFLRSMQRLVLPPANVLLLLMIGFLLIRSCRNLGRLFIATGFLLLYGLSISPVSSALMAPLEKSFRPVNVNSAKADVIVVLGGGTRDRSWLGLEPEPGEKSLQRVVAAVKLHRALHIPVLISGGAGDPDQSQLSDADSMARAALGLGVLEQDIVIENKSRNTLESARAVRGLLKRNRIILVTSVFHMKRSVALLRSRVRCCSSPGRIPRHEPANVVVRLHPQRCGPFHISCRPVRIYQLRMVFVERDL